LKILFCTEFFYPSVGGAQEVVKQIATRMVGFGHDVYVATSQINNSVDRFLGISIKHFEISGNNVLGIRGEVASYQNYVLNNSFDVIFIYAAQQWTFDALWPILGHLKAKKIFVPCGYSAIFNPAYKNYFEKLPDILRYFDTLVFHAKDYRDINFSIKNKLFNYEWIPNGADNTEFSIPPKFSFRKSYLIEKDVDILLTVGSFSGTKGHMEVLIAYSLCKFNKKTVLVLNGNQMPGQNPTSSSKLFLSIYYEFKELGLIFFLKKIIYLLWIWLNKLNHPRMKDLKSLSEKVNKGHFGGNKRVIICDLPRLELIACYFESDLFVFASNIEYSPLVLFESAAAGLPFLTIPVGNSSEIVDWLECGCICPAETDINGFVYVNPTILANEMERMLMDKKLLEILSKSGRKKWENIFNWDMIASQYEKLITTK